MNMEMENNLLIKIMAYCICWLVLGLFGVVMELDRTNRIFSDYKKSYIRYSMCFGGINLLAESILYIERKLGLC